VRGVGSDAWLEHLSVIDRMTQAIARRLPPEAALVVTSDHGMVNLADDQKLDLGDAPSLAQGVRMLGGEGRARHVYAMSGAGTDVLAAWQETLGRRFWVVAGDEAIEAGWFGPVVPDRIRSRIGDVIAAARSLVGVFQREVDSLQPQLVGHHGSMTSAEQLVPFIVVRP
jgi:hypothetical protein